MSASNTVNNSPGSSQGDSGPGSSQGNSNVEERGSVRMPAQEYFLTMNNFKDLLKKTDRKHNQRRPSYLNHDLKKEDESSSEDERLEDQEFLREIESCQKMRVKILLELYKHIDETPLGVWRSFQDKKSEEGDDGCSQ